MQGDSSAPAGLALGEACASDYAKAGEELSGMA